MRTPGTLLGSAAFHHSTGICSTCRACVWFVSAVPATIVDILTTTPSSTR
jgi:hypothetical protein